MLPITERTELKPDTWYALAKYVCEWTLTCAGEVRCPVTVLRLPGVYGRSQKDGSVIGRVVFSIQRAGSVTINGRGSALRDYVYIDDLCRLVMELVPLRYRGVLNVATGESRSILEIVKLIGSVLGKDFEIVCGEAVRERDFDLRFDNRLLLKAIPKFHFSGLEAGIRSYL